MELDLSSGSYFDALYNATVEALRADYDAIEHRWKQYVPDGPSSVEVIEAIEEPWRVAIEARAAELNAAWASLTWHHFVAEDWATYMPRQIDRDARWI